MKLVYDGLSIVRAIIVVAVLVAGCGVGVQAVPLETLPDQPCAGGDLGDYRVVVPNGTVGLQAPGAAFSNVRWPYGFSAERRADSVYLLDRSGVVVAREGQLMHVGGGQNRTGTVSVCQIDGVVYAGG